MNGAVHALGIRQIISGGQTGVDRGALEAAIELGIEHGGWCPRRRLAEDGPIPKRFRLHETESTEYWVRTERNVIDSDGTLVLHLGQLSGGTQFTYRMTRKHNKPSLLIDLGDHPLPQRAREWINEHHIEVVNVAGPRESASKGIGRRAQEFIVSIFSTEVVTMEAKPS